MAPSATGRCALVATADLRANFEAGHFYTPYCNEHAQAQYTAELRDLGTSDPRNKKD